MDYTKSNWQYNYSDTDWLRSEIQDLTTVQTQHIDQIIDMHSWYWTQYSIAEKGKENPNAQVCFGLRLTHDKDNYAYQ
jgi:hypothetical protein